MWLARLTKSLRQSGNTTPFFWTLLVSQYQNVLYYTYIILYYTYIYIRSGNDTQQSSYDKNWFQKKRQTCSTSSYRHPLNLAYWPLTIDRWPLTVDCWPLNVDRWPLTVAYWPLTVDRWPLTVDRWPLTVDHWLLTIDRWPLTVDPLKENERNM